MLDYLHQGRPYDSDGAEGMLLKEECKYYT